MTSAFQMSVATAAMLVMLLFWLRDVMVCHVSTPNVMYVNTVRYNTVQYNTIQDPNLRSLYLFVTSYFLLLFKHFSSLLFLRWFLYLWGNAVAQLVEALRYKPEGRGFDSRWCHWNFSLT